MPAIASERGRLGAVLVILALHVHLPVRLLSPQVFGLMFPAAPAYLALYGLAFALLLYCAFSKRLRGEA
ncbi:MAG: hypothetical protein HY721_24995 [Planctomycetes bacterium]|nr:hypothetical protein [Planctomycetota bacterium]